MPHRSNAFAPSAARSVRYGAVGAALVLPGILAMGALAAHDPALAPLWVGLGGLLAVVLVLLARQLVRPVVEIGADKIRVRTRTSWQIIERGRVHRVEERRQAAGSGKVHHAVLRDASGTEFAVIDLDDVADPAGLLRALRSTPEALHANAS